MMQAFFSKSKYAGLVSAVFYFIATFFNLLPYEAYFVYHLY